MTRKTFGLIIGAVSVLTFIIAFILPDTFKGIVFIVSIIGILLGLGLFFAKTKEEIYRDVQDPILYKKGNIFVLLGFFLGLGARLSIYYLTDLNPSALDIYGRYLSILVILHIIFLFVLIYGVFLILDAKGRSPWNILYIVFLNLIGLAIVYGLKNKDRAPESNVSRDFAIAILVTILMATMSLRPFLDDKNATLFLSIKNEDIIMTNFMFMLGADINAPIDENGVTALIGAAANEDPQLVKKLLDYGAKVDVVTSKGSTALFQSVGKGNIDITKILLDHGANINIQANNTAANVTPLMIAVYTKNKDMVKLLLDRGANRDLKAANGLTALDYAKKIGATEVVNLFEMNNSIINQPKIKRQ
jgi:hypothetical protein